jgi:hypothetical protein
VAALVDAPRYVHAGREGGEEDRGHYQTSLLIASSSQAGAS